ncbi:hypothetical protein V2J09_005359 [Rumex salicifolius]
MCDGDEDGEKGDERAEKVIVKGVKWGVLSEDDEEWYHSREKIKETQLLHHEMQNIHAKKIQHAGGKKKMKVVVHEKKKSYHSNSDSDDEYLCSPDDEEEHGSRERVAYKVERYCIRWWKNQKNQKLGAKCKEGCKWRIYASWDGARESFVVKSVNPIHTCNRQDFENTQETPRFLAKEYLIQYKKNPSWSRKALQDDVLLRFDKRITRHSFYKVKRYAYDLLYGSIGHHYKKLASYMTELQRTDNNTNIVLLTNKARIPTAPDVLKRIYKLCKAYWHKKHKGDELKMHFWRAARAYTKADFEIALKDMRTVNKKAVEDFIEKNPMHFCRSHLKTRSRIEVIVNNLAETFNGYILDARLKPLIYMLEEIRLKVMERMFNNRQLMRKQQSGKICPRIKTRLNQAKEEARQCVSLRASEAEFQKEKYDESYNGSIRTICREKHWSKINYPLDPPEVKIGAGRPKKNRRKDPHERYKRKNKLTKHGLQMTCSKYNGKSHNNRTCPQKDKMPINEGQPQEAKPRGRPRKDGLPNKKAVEDPIQPKRKRGRPKKVVVTKPHNGVPNGRGVYFGPNQRIYVNLGYASVVLSQSSGAPGPSQPSQS